jgi:FlaA1/EpsC-like NDP-sugar epimerase
MKKAPVRTLIIGAGVAGRMVLEEIKKHGDGGYGPVGFIDDDPHKKGMELDGLTVLGGRELIPELVESQKIDAVLIAIPTAPGATIRELVDICGRAGVDCRIVPGIWEIIKGDVHISQIRRVEPEDLLGRETVHLEAVDARTLLGGRRVLVTGAGGSIGSEICRQCARFGPDRMMLLGKGENSIFDIERELEISYPEQAAVATIGDVSNRTRMRHILEDFRPHLIFHAAAHKHVPLMETNVEEAVRNNVIGTMTLVEEASRAGCERLVMLSTDKAVSPTSVMGATKRVAEMYLNSISGEFPMIVVAVRFGNVLGSRGSVVPLFQRQIELGGPITVTHPDATRYFMTVREAAQLVIVAGTKGRSGQVYLLDMGEPMKILDLAKHMITVSGCEEGRDVSIEFTGLRPGEKLHEKLVSDHETVSKTEHDKIMAIEWDSGLTKEEILADIAELSRLAEAGDSAGILAKLEQMLPEFKAREES